ncbi:uncharacterized protein TNCV_1324811 [Trichonephila clavipes]|nr:uncharacterized protein TNCV_1324811 [Trichonephila clavipes]
MRGRRKDRLSEYVGFYDSLLEKPEMWEEGVTFQIGLGKDVWGMVQRYLRQDLMWFHIMVKHDVFDTFRKEMEKIRDQCVILPFDVCAMDWGYRKIIVEQLGNKNVSSWEKVAKHVPDPWYNVRWEVSIHVTGWKFLNCVIPLHPRDEEELYLHLYGNKKWHLKDHECSFQRIRDERYVLSRKQQNTMKEIKKVKKEWAMDQKVILKAKLNEMKTKNDLIRRENDILKTKEQEWKTKEQERKTKEQEWKTKEQEWKTKENEWKTKENELNSKLQGMSRENKILKRVLQGKRVDKISSNPWRWNSRVKRLSRPPSALSQLSRSLANFSD